MSPTKYCNAIQCTDCRDYKECLQSQIEADELKGKIVKIKEFVHENKRND